MDYLSDLQGSNGRQKRAIEIFFCYAHKDKKFVDELEQQLLALKNQGLNIKWTSREVTARREWVQTFNKHTSTADIILPLLSTDFIASDYLRSSDMQMVFSRQQKENVHIIPIQIRPANHTNTPIVIFKSLPQNNRPVSLWRNKDEAFLDISIGIKGAIEEIQLQNREGIPSRDVVTYQVVSMEMNSVTIEDMQEDDRETKVISPIIDRLPYLLDLNNEKPKKKRSRKSTTSNINKASSGLVEQLPLFLDPSLEAELNQWSSKNLIDDYEYLRSQAQYKLTNDQPQKALEILEDVDIGSVPSKQRWRLSALRGHCYFGLGKFVPARKEYLDALQEKPIIVPKEQIVEEGILYLQAAEADRELGKLTTAADLYHIALAHMNTQTRVGYLADAHWGLALVLFEQTHIDSESSSDLNDEQKRLLQEAFYHAKAARQLYHHSGDSINAASITCDMALFEQATGDIENASKHLSNVIGVWTPMLQQRNSNTKEGHKRLREYNSIVSAASCYLAGIEIERGQYQDALRHVQVAEKTAEKSYPIRQVEAAIMRGTALEAQDSSDLNVEKALRKAIDITSGTDLLGAQIRAHDLLGRHFFKIGEVDRENEELDQVRKISQTAMFSH